MTLIGPEGENLIFLISQPRAGSTLLQRMLGSHPEIHTVSEPWIMLHPLYALRSEGHEAEYNAQSAWKGLRSFLDTLPEGEKNYVEAVRRMYSALYSQGLAASGKRLFLDKTPRYYFIIPELQRVFPRARYIILLRNPLAVLSSILTTWVNQLFSLSKWKQDLIVAPRLLLEGRKRLGNKAIVVHYEELVRSPEDELRRVCKELGVDFALEMVEYGTRGLPKWRFGDQKDVYERVRPIHHEIEKWQSAIDNPQTWRLAHDYLKLLDHKTIEQMGYSYAALRRALREHMPRWIRRRATFPLIWVLKTHSMRYNKLMRPLLLLAGVIARKGVRGTWTYVIRRARGLRSRP